MRSSHMLIGLALIAMAIMGAEGGCGQSNLFDGYQDTDAPSARLENANTAINDGNYAEAVALLESLCGTDPAAPTCDDATAALLASAYMGVSGFNAFDLVAAVETFDPSDPSALYDAFAGMIDPAALGDLESAIALLEAITRSPEEELLLGMASAAHLVGVILAAADQGDGTYGPFVVSPALAATVNTDMDRLLAATAAVEATSGALALTDEMQGFEDHIENADDPLPTPNDGTIEQSELQAYVDRIY